MSAWLSWHPELPFGFIAAGAWLALALERSGASGPAQSGWICLITISSGAPPVNLSGLIHLPLMLAATMIPVTMPWLQHVAITSPAKRRVRAMALYLAAYLVVWLAVLILPAFLLESVVTAAAPGVLVAVALIVASIWHMAPARRRALANCVWTVPLAVAGRPADVACVRLGAQEARRCVAICGALMGVMLVAGTNLPLMLFTTAIGFASMWTTPGFAHRRLVAASLAVGALAILLVG
jgi:predicted metal-binding membrane protein